MEDTRNDVDTLVNILKREEEDHIGADKEITFSANNKEMLRLCANGDIYVRGLLTGNDTQVVSGMRDYLKHCGFI